MRKPIYFVSRNQSVWKHLSELERPPLPSELDPLLPVNDGSIAWIVQTYLHLRNRGANVRLSAHIQSDAINVIHYDDLSWKRLPFRGFIVAVQADRGRPEVADMRIVQNQLCIREPKTDLYVPLWTQPALKPRDESRGNRFEQITYFGLECYISPAFLSDAFKSELEKIGVKFDIKTELSEWSDYTQTDAVLAVRQVTNYDLSIKPPTKLLNAWRAGCVAILGPEPGFRQIATPNEDYFEASDPEQVLNIVRRLKSETNLFEKMRKLGDKKFSKFNDDALSQQWLDLLTGSIYEHYEQWRRRGRPFGMLLRMSEYPRRVRAHLQEKEFFLKNIY